MMILLIIMPIVLLIIGLVDAALWDCDDEDISWKELEKLEEDDREYWQR